MFNLTKVEKQQTVEPAVVSVMMSLCLRCVLPDDHALVLVVDHHVSVHVVSQSVDVRGVLVLSLGWGVGGVSD